MRTVNSFYFPFEHVWLRDHEAIPNSFYDAHRLAKLNPPPAAWGGWGKLVVIRPEIEGKGATATQATNG